MSSSIFILCPQINEARLTSSCPSHDGCPSQSQDFTSIIPMPGPGREPRNLACNADALTLHYRVSGFFFVRNPDLLKSICFYLNQLLAYIKHLLDLTINVV